MYGHNVIHCEGKVEGSSVNPLDIDRLVIMAIQVGY